MENPIRLNRRGFLRRAGGFAAGAAAATLSDIAKGAAAGRPKRSPNILFFLVDDMGWMDSTLYGSRYYETPNVERLARRGMMFTDAYAASPLCSPTRASIMTGKYPGRLKITTPAGHLPPLPDVPLLAESAQPWMKMVCPRSRRFLPLEEYTIAEAFKDAGYTTGFIGKWHLGHEPWWPKKQGFEVNIAGGHYPGPPSYFSPYKIKTLPDGPPGEYITDRLTDETTAYLEKNRDRPFFLCFWHYAVHAPFQAKEEITKKYRGRKDPRGRQKCPVMASMLQSMDESLGRVLDKLDSLGIADDTIVIFTSDNGGNMYNRVEGEPPTNNHPLRSGKGNIHEGGVREPCIVVWPGVVAPGSKCLEVISSIDFYPTMLEMANIEKKKDHRVDGESTVPLLKQTGKLDRDAIFCHFPHYITATQNLPSTSVRKSHWKLIRVYGEGPDRSPAYELYNLKDDVGETNNLAEKMPERVRELDAMIERHLKNTEAIVPIPNPRYRPGATHQAFAPAVGGWKPAGTCGLEQKGGRLVVDSTGRDPHLAAAKVPAHSGPIEFKARIKCATKGPGQVFWTTETARRHHKSRSVVFDLTHDGGWHEYSVRLPVKGRLGGLRLDPGTGEGRIEIDWIRIARPDGEVLRAWDFEE